MQGMRIVECEMDQANDLLAQAGPMRVAGRKLFLLAGADCVGHVVASLVVWNEDEGEYNDASPLLE